MRFDASRTDGYTADVKLPTELPVMTLPDTLLFPRAWLPLHIFEPRYRKMLADCLAGQRMFVVALARRDRQGAEQPAPHTVAGAGLIRMSVSQPDGTSNIALQGVRRVRLCEHRPGSAEHDYAVARIEPLESVGDTSEVERQQLVEAVNRLARARARLGKSWPAPMLDWLLAIENADLFSDLVSHTLLENVRDKQAMLETLDVEERLRKLAVLLKQQTEQLRTWKKLQGKLRNDDVGKN